MLFTSVDSGLSIPVAHCKQQWGDRVARPGNPRDSAASGSSDDSIIPQQHDGEMSAQVSAAFVCLSRFHLTPVHGLLCRGETTTDLMLLILTQRQYTLTWKNILIFSKYTGVKLTDW